MISNDNNNNENTRNNGNTDNNNTGNGNSDIQRQFYEDDLLILPHGETISDMYRGVAYEIKRSTFGHLCGYTYMDKDSADYDIDHTLGSVFHVHGGITYHDGSKIGFDTAHMMDWSAAMAPFFKSYTGTYKNVEFVRNELKQLIDQIVARRNTVINATD
jgi:hypothetical protein